MRRDAEQALRSKRNADQEGSMVGEAVRILPTGRLLPPPPRIESRCRYEKTYSSDCMGCQRPGAALMQTARLSGKREAGRIRAPKAACSVFFRPLASLPVAKSEAPVR